MLSSPLFLPWRPIWDSICPELTQRVDEVVKRRQQGRQIPPQPPNRREVSALVVALELADGKLTSAAFVQQKLVPLLIACAWPRWLLLEEALDEGARSGDLHLASQILRNQIEELDILRAVAHIVLCDDDEMLTQPALERDMRVVRQKVLPRLRPKSEEELLSQAASTPSDRPASLGRAYDSLSEYVHPNYGSHMLAVRPHTPRAATVICEAFLAVYEAFAGLPWVQSETPRELPATNTEPPSLADPFGELAEHTIPILKPHLPNVSDTSWKEAVKALRTLALDINEAPSWPDGPRLEVIDALFQAGALPAAWPDAFRSASAINSYSTLVTLEEDLARAAKEFLPDIHTGPSKDHLSVLLSALAFAITLTEYKLHSLRRHAATLINGSNVLGAAVAVRSIVEHHAVAVALSQKMDAVWERLKKGSVVDATLEEAEKQVARVLAGSKQPPDKAVAWRTLWKETVTKPYNVMTPIKLLDEKEPGLLKAYGQLSHIVHGTIATGGDLLGESGAMSPQFPTLGQLTLFLAKLSTRDAVLNRQASAMLLAHRLSQAKGSSSGLQGGIRAMALPDNQKLKKGRDVRGDGTRESPFRFRQGLLYHEAFRRYLAQEGITVVSRQVVSVEGGIVDCVNVENGHKLYFLNDSFPFGPTSGA